MRDIITNKHTKTISRNGNSNGICSFYIFTPEEISIWEKLKVFNSKEISKGTGINISRVFRLKTFGGMKLIERDLITQFIKTKE